MSTVQKVKFRKLLRLISNKKVSTNNINSNINVNDIVKNDKKKDKKDNIPIHNIINNRQTKPPPEEEKTIELINDPNQLQIENIIKCETCKHKMADNTILYRCTSDECKDSATGHVLCEDCFKYLHKKEKKLHSFDKTADYIVSINNVIKSGLNKKYVQLGKMLIHFKNEYKTNKFYHALFGGLNILSVIANAVMHEGTTFETDCRVGLFVCGLELSVLLYRVYQNKIETSAEIELLVDKSLISNIMGTTALVSAWNSGGSYCTGAGTVAVILLASLLIGIGVKIGSGWVYDQIFVPTEQVARETYFQDALQFFQFPKDISIVQDTQKFNKQKLKKLYFRYALRHHPDRNNCTDSKQWLKLCKYYGVLVALCDERDQNNIVQPQNNIASVSQ